MSLSANFCFWLILFKIAVLGGYLSVKLTVKTVKGHSWLPIDKFNLSMQSSHFFDDDLI
jgi:hypothetical protein